MTKKKIIAGVGYILVGWFLAAFAGIALAALIGTGVVIWGGFSQPFGKMVVSTSGVGTVLSYLAFAILVAGCIVSFLSMVGSLIRRAPVKLLHY
jgi:hypothetical protein